MCNGIKTMHREELETNEGKILLFKKIKMGIQQVRSGMNDLFGLLSVDEWAMDPDVEGIAQAELVQLRHSGVGCKERLKLTF